MVVEHIVRKILNLQVDEVFQIFRPDLQVQSRIIFVTFINSIEIAGDKFVT
ncbi:hypothetical protein N7G274_009346 [Stereocaulon virgatum]|uniref:Uncharacterized protein n=1 Tax=Stereocaulon virgatum TaxID=373712 RepID=A0ABR3ZY16_9LECA